MTLARLVLVTALSTALGCSERASSEPDPMPMPGLQGGLCLAPDGHCASAGAVCNQDENYCFDPDDPCAGFACGGTDRGVCTAREGLPSCECDEGFQNQTFSLYCCPTDGSDPSCG